MEENVEILDNEVEKEAARKKFDDAKAAFDKEVSDYNKKKFLVTYDENTSLQLLNFIDTKAKWKGELSKAIVECSSLVKFAIQEMKEQGFKGIMLNNLVLETVVYLMSNYEGTGKDYATIHVNMLTPLYETLQAAHREKMKAEELREKMSDAAIELDAIEQGITVQEYRTKIEESQKGK